MEETNPAGHIDLTEIIEDDEFERLLSKIHAPSPAQVAELSSQHVRYEKLPPLDVSTATQRQYAREVNRLREWTNVANKSARSWQAQALYWNKLALRAWASRQASVAQAAERERAVKRERDMFAVIAAKLPDHVKNVPGVQEFLESLGDGKETAGGADGVPLVDLTMADWFELMRDRVEVAEKRAKEAMEASHVSRMGKGKGETDRGGMTDKALVGKIRDLELENTRLQKTKDSELLGTMRNLELENARLQRASNLAQQQFLTDGQKLETENKRLRATIDHLESTSHSELLGKMKGLEMENTRLQKANDLELLGKIKDLEMENTRLEKSNSLQSVARQQSATDRHELETENKRLQQMIGHLKSRLNDARSDLDNAQGDDNGDDGMHVHLALQTLYRYYRTMKSLLVAFHLQLFQWRDFAAMANDGNGARVFENLNQAFLVMRKLTSSRKHLVVITRNKDAADADTLSAVSDAQKKKVQEALVRVCGVCTAETDLSFWQEFQLTLQKEKFHPEWNDLEEKLKPKVDAMELQDLFRNGLWIERKTFQVPDED